MSEFFVDADGLDTGRNGFGEKASEIESLAQRIAALGDPGRVAAAAGNDKNGTNFTQTHVKAVGEIHDGIKAWSRAVDGTKVAIGDMASSFREADAGAFDMATDLRNSFEKLNDGSGGSSDGSSNPPLARREAALEPTQAFTAKRRLAEPAEKTVALERAQRIEAMPAERGVPAEPLQPREFVRSSKPGEVTPEIPLEPTRSFQRDVGIPDEGVVTEGVSTRPIPTTPA
ncbi:hypothetical protein [Amycolatopsis saalfeldensis]|uniref:Excreted virulence factor EspC, type VII ESX diderm n=1 Tax=Amycolatopsis saalfeldensis TaxID=394193 RepID=A0A1H8YJK3_9PSEU|nr:hypothetical protein [Amycolatopsis saalfeldensis]SEP52336.1 hypothetical protein SAMN04489732_119218 [Amycolatopsis saalfeldensis]